MWLKLQERSLTCTRVEMPCAKRIKVHSRCWDKPLVKSLQWMWSDLSLSPHGRSLPQCLLQREIRGENQGKDRGAKKGTDWRDPTWLRLLNSRLESSTKRELSWRLTARPHISEERGEESCRGEPASAIDFWREYMSAAAESRFQQIARNMEPFWRLVGHHVDEGFRPCEH